MVNKNIFMRSVCLFILFSLFYSCAPSTLKFIGDNTKVKDCFYIGIGQNSKFAFWRIGEYDSEMKEIFNYVLVLENPERYVEYNNYINIILEREGKQTIIETDSCKIRNIYSEINPAKFIILKQKLNIPDSLNFIPIDRKDY